MKNRLKKALMSQDGRCSWWFNGNWKKCCVAHDIAVADAFCLKNESIRYLADINLKLCVNKKCKGMGTVMHFGIKSFLKIRKKLFKKPMY